MKNTAKGFAWLPILLVVGLVIVVGGAYVYMQHKHQLALAQPTVALSQQDECYRKNSAGVFFGSVLVPEADPATFEDQSSYGLCFGQDARHVYRDATILAGFNPATFKSLWYAKLGPVLFFQNGSSIVAFTYTADNDSSFQNMAIVPNGDPQTFQELNGGYDFAPWARDKHNVYCNGAVITGADASLAHIATQGNDIVLQTVVNGTAVAYDSECKLISQ